MQGYVGVIVRISALLCLLLGKQGRPVRQVLQNLAIVLLHSSTGGLGVHRKRLGYIGNSIRGLVVIVRKPVETDQIEIEQRPQSQRLPFGFGKVFHTARFFQLLNVAQQGVDLQNAVISTAPETGISIAVGSVVERIECIQSASGSKNREVTALGITVHKKVSAVIRR